MQRNSQYGAFAQHIERRRGGDCAQVIQTLFVVCASEPVNGIAAVLAFALEVVNLHACNLIARWITKQKNREATCFDGHAASGRTDKHGCVTNRVH